MNRPDGYRVNSNDPMYQIVPYIMPTRLDASNNIRLSFDMEPIQQYTKNCRKNGIPISHMAVIISAFVRIVSQYPYLNRFCINKKIYARKHICVSFVTLSDTGETVCKVYFEPDDTIFDVNRKINEAVEGARSNTDNSMDKFAAKLLKIPGLLSIGVAFLKWLDKHFGMPFWAIDGSPFHTTMFLTNLASIRTNSVHHHLYEFGSVGIFFAMGQPYKKTFINDDGSADEKKIFDLSITTDERICSGHYYAQSFHDIKKILADPSVLEQKPKQIHYDEDIKCKHPVWRTPEGKHDMPKCVKELF